MKKLSVIAMAAILALALAGCGSSGASSSAASSSESASSSAEVSSSASASSQAVATFNWADVKTADEAAKGAGFAKFGVMDKVAVDDHQFKDPKFAYAGGVAQATYEEGAVSLIVRMADGKHDAPLTDRDKTEFAQSWSKSYESCDVTLYGEAKGAATVFTWTDGAKEFGVTYQGKDGKDVSLDSDEVAAIVKGIKEANGAEKKAEEKSESSASQNVVPIVIGMSAADAGAAITAAGLSPDGNTEGTVVSQSPEAGTVLEPGDTVSIKTESNNSNLCEVPSVVGMSATEAGAAITAAGLSPDGDTEGTIVAQEPAPGTMLDPGDTVSISADNSANGLAEVPDVVGMDAADAGAAIEAAGLSPDGDAEGTVVAQEPAAGVLLDPGDTVSIKAE